MDTREAILARLATLMETIAGADEVGRNELVGDDTTLRRIMVLDGDEEASESDPLNRPPASPRIMRMYPLVVLQASAKAKDVGADISDLRGKVIKAVETDATLAALTLNGRGGRYVGVESGLAMGVLTVGSSPLKFAFAYMLRPDQF